jgi:hypothetical protein
MIIANENTSVPFPVLLLDKFVIAIVLLSILTGCAEYPTGREDFVSRRAIADQSKAVDLCKRAGRSDCLPSR